jgi:hypothetical protein
MTQTQDEQNVGTPVTPAQDGATTPITEDATNQPVAAEPVAEAPVAEAPKAEENSFLDSGKEVVSETLNTGMEKIQ